MRGKPLQLSHDNSAFFSLSSSAMGKIIKFDPDRRRKGDKRCWTRPQDYGVTSTPKPQRQPQPARAALPAIREAPARTRLRAKLTVGGVIALGVLTSLYGLT